MGAVRVKVDVQVRGLDQLKRELALLSSPDAARLSKNAAMAGARVIARHARANAPVETGALRASIKAMRPPSGQSAGQRVALAGSKLFYSRLVELGTRHMSPRSFLRRASDENAVEIRAKIEQNLSNALDRLIKTKRFETEDKGDEFGPGVP
jgi:HK97 gp10 family phage protein